MGLLVTPTKTSRGLDGVLMSIHCDPRHSGVGMIKNRNQPMEEPLVGGHSQPHQRVSPRCPFPKSQLGLVSPEAPERLRPVCSTLQCPADVVEVRPPRTCWKVWKKLETKKGGTKVQLRDMVQASGQAIENLLRGATAAGGKGEGLQTPRDGLSRLPDIPPVSSSRPDRLDPETVWPSARQEDPPFGLWEWGVR